MPIRVSIAEVFRAQLDSPKCKKEVKQVVSIDHNSVVRLVSKGSCQFQFAVKQQIELKEQPMEATDEIKVN